MVTSPLFVQLKPSSLDLYLPDKESNLKSKKSKQLSRSLHPKQSLKQVCSFIGMINYYKDHIPHRSDLLTPLTTLTKKGARFKWTDDCQHSFDELKNLLAKQTVLTYPDFTIPFEIYTDTSNRQIGSVIQQSG
jgi:hypothetical protein